MNEMHKFGTQEDLEEILAAQGVCTPDFRKPCTDVYAGMGCLEQGKLVKGKITQVNEQEVLVDVNYKDKGIVDRAEFKDTDSLELGFEIEVFVEKLEDEDGRLILSKQKADFVRSWDRVHTAFENNEVVHGTLTKRIKGGVVVDLFGIKAFLPSSQIDLHYIPNIDALIGQELDFKVIEINKARRNVVVSRRVILEEARSKMQNPISQAAEKVPACQNPDSSAFMQRNDMGSRILGKYQIIKEESDVLKYGQYNGNEYRIEIVAKTPTCGKYSDIAKRINSVSHKNISNLKIEEDFKNFYFVDKNFGEGYSDLKAQWFGSNYASLIKC